MNLWPLVPSRYLHLPLFVVTLLEVGGCVLTLYISLQGGMNAGRLGGSPRSTALVHSKAAGKTVGEKPTQRQKTCLGNGFSTGLHCRFFYVGHCKSMTCLLAFADCVS